MPEVVSSVEYRPLERSAPCGITSAVLSRPKCSTRASTGVISTASTSASSSGCGSIFSTTVGTRSWSRISTERTSGSRWKRAWKRPPSSTWASASSPIPWWWAMYELTSENDAPSSAAATRPGV